MPYQEAGLSPELRAACARAVHVRLPDGSYLRAGRAALFVLDRIGFHRSARTLSRRPMVWAVELGYWVVARNRRFFAEFLVTEE